MTQVLLAVLAFAAIQEKTLTGEWALEFTTPAWVALLAALLLRERFTTGRVISIACGFIGVLVILRPGIAALTPASFVVLVCALLFALTSIATKALTTTDSTFTQDGRQSRSSSGVMAAWPLFQQALPAPNAGIGRGRPGCTAWRGSSRPL